MVKLTPTGVKINNNLVWTSHNTWGVDVNTGVFAVLLPENHAVLPKMAILLIPQS